MQFYITLEHQSIHSAVPQPQNNHALRNKNNTRKKSGGGPPRVTDSRNLPRDTRVKVTLVDRPLLTPVAQKLCRCELVTCSLSIRRASSQERSVLWVRMVRLVPQFAVHLCRSLVKIFRLPPPSYTHTNQSLDPFICA
jgi:hypothetical protein